MSSDQRKHFRRGELGGQRMEGRKDVLAAFRNGTVDFKSRVFVSVAGKGVSRNSELE